MSVFAICICEFCFIIHFSCLARGLLGTRPAAADRHTWSAGSEADGSPDVSSPMFAAGVLQQISFGCPRPEVPRHENVQDPPDSHHEESESEEYDGVGHGEEILPFQQESGDEIWVITGGRV